MTKRKDNPKKSIWTPEIAAKLKDLAARAPKLSAQQIAAQLGPAFTRNSVIGYCHRSGIQLGLAPTPKKTTEPRTYNRRQASKSARTEVIIRKTSPYSGEETKPTTGQILDFSKIQLKTHGCSFIIGDPHRNAARCQNPAMSGKSYCAHHYAVCYRIKPRSDAA